MPPADVRPLTTTSGRLARPASGPKAAICFRPIADIAVDWQIAWMGSENVIMLTIAAAAGNVLIYGLLGWFLAVRIGFAAEACLAGCCLAIGFAIGSFGGHAGTEAEAALALRGAGYVLGVGASIALLLRLHARGGRGRL